MQEKQKKITSDFKKSFVNGISGCFGVACQTIGLLWHLNLKQECYRSGRRTKDAVIQLYRSGGIFRFYQGFFTAFRSASLARFGDNFFSSFITNELEKNKSIIKYQIVDDSSLECVGQIEDLKKNIMELVGGD